MTTPEAAEFLGESDRPAVRALLDELVRAGEIEAVGERRRRRWVARSEGPSRGSASAAVGTDSGGDVGWRARERRRMLDEGVYRNQSELARGEGVSTAAVSKKLRGRDRDRLPRVLDRTYTPKYKWGRAWVR